MVVGQITYHGLVTASVMVGMGGVRQNPAEQVIAGGKMNESNKEIMVCLGLQPIDVTMWRCDCGVKRASIRKV